MRAVARLRGLAAALLPGRGSARREAAREERRRAIAAFITAPEMLGAAGLPPDLRQATGLGGTAGIGEAIMGHLRAFEGDHVGAAEAFWRAASAIPDIDDDATDGTRQARLAKALALMLLARHAVRAGMQDTAWSGLGTAVDVAARAVRLQPMLLHLRVEQAELLRSLGRHAEALDALAAAQPTGVELASRYRIADVAGEIAAGAGDDALLARGEAGFITPALSPGDETGPADPPETDEGACAYAWVIAFRAGKLAFTRAERAAPASPDRGALADLAARRFSRALALMKAAPPTPALATDRANIEDWRRLAETLAADAALAAGEPLLASARYRRSGEADHAARAERLGAWALEARPNRFAAASLLAEPCASETEETAFSLLGEAAARRRDPDEVALPAPVEPIVVEISDPLIDAALADRVINDEQEPSIRTLRARLWDRHRFRLPGVRLRGIDEPASAGRIVVRLRGQAVLDYRVPEGARWALAAGFLVRHAGLEKLPEAAPATGGTSCSWVGPGQAAPVIALREAAFAAVGALEEAVLPAMPRLTGLDQAAEALPLLPPEHLAHALGVLRALLAERMPIGEDAVLDLVRARVLAGDAPGQVLSRLRALPGLRPRLWGNETGRKPVQLPMHELDAFLAVSGDAAARERLVHAARAATSGIEAPVLVVPVAAARATVRAALAEALPDLPVLSSAERAGRP